MADHIRANRRPAGVSVALPGGGMSIRDVVSLAVDAERAGADGVYVTEAWRSAFVPLAAIATATERVKLGPYVINAYGRSPFIAGMSALDLDDLSGGRVVLGVGSGNVFTNRSYQGLETERPLTKMAEYVELLQRIVRAVPGTPVDYRGEIHSMRGWYPQARPVRPSIPVYLAALFPKMRRVAARVADGVAVGALQSVDHIEGEVVPAIHKAAADAGRSPDAVGVMMAGFVSVADDRDEAYDGARGGIVNLFAPKPHRHYEHALRSQGYGTVLDQVLSRLLQGDERGARAAVPDEMVERLAIAGTPADCVARVAEYGPLVDEVILVNARAARHRTDPAAGTLNESTVAAYHAVVELAGRAALR